MMILAPPVMRSSVVIYKDESNSLLELPLDLPRPRLDPSDCHGTGGAANMRRCYQHTGHGVQ